MDETGDSRRLSRRYALLGGLAATSLALTTAAAKAVWEPMTPQGRLTSLIGPDKAAARAIGRVYLDAHAHEAHADALVETILARLELDGRALQGMHYAALAERIDAVIGRDFDAGDTVTLDGWVLSRTEVRLCALVAVTS